MKVAIISAILLGLTVAQTTNTWDAKARFCTVANETTACADMTNACCGSITTKVGTAGAKVLNRCISRNLVEDLPNYSYTTGSTTTTVAYACLNSTRPANYEVYSSCSNDTTCSSGYCCASYNYTVSQNGQTSKNLTENKCIPGNIGRDNGTLTEFLFGNTGNLGDINT